MKTDRPSKSFGSCKLDESPILKSAQNITNQLPQTPKIDVFIHSFFRLQISILQKWATQLNLRSKAGIFSRVANRRERKGRSGRRTGSLFLIVVLMKIFDSRKRCFLQHTFGLISIMFSLAFSYTTRVSLRANNASKILRHSKSLARFVAASNSDSSSNRPNLSYSYSLCLQIPTIEEMEEVGALLSVLSNPPDAIFLDGGKFE